MRKLLLASAAMLGATSGIASAQTPPAPPIQFMPTQGMQVGPSAANSIAQTSNNVNGQPSTFHGYSNTFFGAIPAPQPGTVVIRLNGKVEVDMDAFWTQANESHASTAASGAAGTGPGGYTGYKLNPINFGAFLRLYPAVDGMATNGLRYGAAAELRENFNNPNGQALVAGGNSAAGVQPTGFNGGAPTGAAAATTTVSAASSGSAYSSSETIFVRRAFTYLAADNVGIVRFGQTDGVIGVFDPCIFSAGCWDAGVGNFNGGMIQATAPTNLGGIPFVWMAQAGAEYGNTKITYLSPQIFGIDVGFQYAPSMGNGYSNSTGGTAQGPALCAQAGPNCVGTTTGIDGTRWFNQVAIGARWQGQFGPVQGGLMAVYTTAGKESVFGPALYSGAGQPGHKASGSAGVGNQYDNLSFTEAAGYATLDTGMGAVTYSFDWVGGATNGQDVMKPVGGANMSAIVTGFLYKNGPVTLGAEMADLWYQGSVALTGISQRHEYEIAFGGNYNLAPGLYLVGEYMYMYRHQGGVDAVSGATTNPTEGAAGYVPTRDIHGQGILFSTVVNW